MPVNYPCSKCKKACKEDVEEGEESICCDKCDKWVHYTCTNLTGEELELYQAPDMLYHCERCLNTCLICNRYCRKNQKSTRCCACNNLIHSKCRDSSFGRFFNDSGSPDMFFCSPCIDQTPVIETNIAPVSSIINDLIHEVKTDSGPNEISSSSLVLNTLNDHLSPLPNVTDFVNASHYYDVDKLNCSIIDNPDHLLLLHINAVSLPKNTDKINDLIAQLHKPPSIIQISETKLHDDKEEDQLPQIQINGYKIIHNNSSTQAGGTALYISENLKFITRTDLTINMPHVECSFIELICENTSKNPLIGVVYRHPSNSAYARLFTVELEELLDKCTRKGTQVFLAGDINIDLSKSTIESTEYVESLASLGFTCHINKPTRIFRCEGATNTSFSTLDHILSNGNPDCVKSGILTYHISDHLPVFALVNTAKPAIYKDREIYKRDFKPCLKDTFLKHLDSKLKELEFDETNPDSNMEIIVSTIQSAIDHIFPLKKLSNKRKKFVQNPWKSKNL